MEFIIEKPKTWKGLSYILKSSILQNAIVSKGLDCYVHLIYMTPQGDNHINCMLINAEYWLPNQNINYCRFYIRTGVVPATERKIVSQILNEEVLPLLLDWMEAQINKPLNSTTLRSGFYAFYKDSKLVINKPSF